MAITIISGYTDFRSTTASARGTIASYTYDYAGNNYLLVTGTPTFATTDSWITTTWPTGYTGSSTNSTYLTAYSTGAQEGKNWVRYATEFLSTADLVTCAGLDTQQIITANNNWYFGFEPVPAMGQLYGSGTVITTYNSTNALQVGAVPASGFPAGAYVTGILSPTQFTMSAAPTAALSNTSINFLLSSTLGTASSSSTTVTLASGTTAGLYVGTIVYVSSGTGTFVHGTYVTAISNSTTFTVSTAPSVALSSATVVYYNNALGWLTSTSSTSAISTAYAVTAPVGYGTSNANVTSQRWFFTSTTNIQGTNLGPASAQTGSFWMQTYQNSSTAYYFWLFSPGLPASTNPFLSYYSYDGKGQILLGKTQTTSGSSPSVSTSLSMPTWVTSPTYSVANAVNASSSGTTITAYGIPPGLQPGAYVTVSSGTGTFAAGTYVVSVNSTAGNSFTVSQAPTVILSSATILFANTSSNGGLPPGLSLNSSTGAITGTLTTTGLTGYNAYYFTLRVDFIWPSSYHTYPSSISLTGASAGNFYYEVVIPITDSTVGTDNSDMVVASLVTISSYIPSTSAVSVGTATVSDNIPLSINNTVAPNNSDPKRTSVIVIG